MNPVDILLIVILAAAVALALRRVVKNRRKGCSCGCEGCSGSCPAQQNKSQKS